jgi:NAD(P)-dependent dehydrogenase (short-subunit alcohol dehydrogenase family)
MVLSLCGRDGAALAETARLARRKGAECFESLFDVRDGEALSAWLAGSDRRAPLELVVANAGICRGLGPEGLEAPWDAVETLRVNSESCALTALYAAKLMLSRGRGQIAVVSSQAGKFPLTFTPSYSASKAAASSYALSLRDGMAPFGIEVCCVCPGYVESPMQKTFAGGIFRAWTAERAASAIAARLRRNPREIRFPFLMRIMTALYLFTPCPLKPALLRAFSFKVERAGGNAAEAHGPGAAAPGGSVPDAGGQDGPEGRED